MSVFVLRVLWLYLHSLVGFFSLKFLIKAESFKDKVSGTRKFLLFQFVILKSLQKLLPSFVFYFLNLRFGG